MDVESFCRTIRKFVPLSGLVKRVPNASSLLMLTPGMPVLESPIQSVLRNSGDERMNILWRFSSSYLSDSWRVSRMGEP